MKKPGKKKLKERPINDRMRRVCELVVQGKPAGRAYEMAGYSARGDIANRAASRLLQHPRVAEYLAMLQAEASRKAEFTRDDLVGYLVQVLKTPVGEVTAESPLCQRMKVDEAGGFLVEMPGKIAAAKQLAEIMGWNKPAEVKVDVSEKLAEIVRRVRGS